jgi:predicted phosphodiesterase
VSRTLIISDLHLGAYAAHCVLERPAVLPRLLAQLSGFDRLVILGDLIELGEGRAPEEVLEIAAPVLSAIGAALGTRVPELGPGSDTAAEIIVLPGNHDRRMVGPWIAGCGEDLPLEGEVPPDATPVLAEVVGLLGAGGARVSVRYPAVALSERVFLHHGHYLDRVLQPEGPYGFRQRPAYSRPVQYERGRIPQQKPTAVKWVQHRLLRPSFAQLTTALLNWQMRRHSLPALARVCGALGVSTDYVVFGHVHRLGPLPGDRLRQWDYPLGSGAAPTRFVNTGSWVEEELLVGDRRPPHPYWPGGAVIIEADGIPRPVELVDVES